MGYAALNSNVGDIMHNTPREKKRIPSRHNIGQFITTIFTSSDEFWLPFPDASNAIYFQNNFSAR